MNDTLVIQLYPTAAVESIRQPFPHKRNKKLEMEAILNALDRLVSGENGKSMRPEEAISFLRARTDEARQMFAMREKKFVPHLTTYMNQRRYLRVKIDDTPKELADCVSILSCYPGIAEVDVDAHWQVLQVIDNLILFTRATHGDAAASYIRQRVIRFAECVSRWPAEDLQYLVSPTRFFKERRHENDERFWQRTPKAGFESERAQLARIM